MTLTATIPVAPTFLLRARHAAEVWSARPLISPEWYISLGEPTPTGLLVHHHLMDWPSAAHRRLWQRCRYGCSATVIDRLSSADFSLLFDTDSLWSRRYFVNLFAAFLHTGPWADLADPAASRAATLQWQSLWMRDTRAGQSGWRHPQWAWLFIPDFAPLAPLNAHLPATSDPLPLGPWLAQTIPLVQDADPTWLSDQPLVPLQLIGMQWAMWQAMGLGYFEPSAEVNDGGPTRRL